MLEFYPAAHHHLHHPHFHHHTLIKDESNNNVVVPDKLTTIGGDCSTDKEDNGIKCEKNYEICEGCGHKIHDRYLMRVADVSWHEHCLLCSVCGVNLNHSCYARNTKLYCKADYDRIFSIKCSRCTERVHAQDMVMRVQQHIYHLPCFICSVCCRPLEKGEQYFMRSGQLFCNLHYDTSFYSSGPSSYGGPGSVVDDLDDDMDDGMCSIRTRDGRRGPKRPRTILTSVQRRQFKASFEVSPKPCRKVREALAKDTGLSVRVVQVWFQNQRAKMKKIQRKAKHSDSGDKQAGDKESKEEKSIKQETSGGESYIGLDSSFGSAGQPMNPNHPYSPDDYPANSNDSFCSSDVSLDGSSFEQMDEGTSDTFHNLGAGGGGEMQRNSSANTNNNNSYPSPNLITLSSGIINPIDKLYLMQDSYFSGE